jgi:DNA invertase Pin-like site-specific DNA recombinase
MSLSHDMEHIDVYTEEGRRRLIKECKELEAENAELKQSKIELSRIENLIALSDFGVDLDAETYDQVEEMVGALKKAEVEIIELKQQLALEKQHRNGHLPSCKGVDPDKHQCDCGYLDGYAYRKLYEQLAEARQLVREALSYSSPSWTERAEKFLDNT